MDSDDLIEPRLRACILRALNVPDFPLRRTTRAYEVPRWDSISHALVIVAVEDEFGVRFSTKDLLALETVGDLEDLVKRSMA